MRLNLQEHQQEAYDNVTKLFEEGNKAIVIFPTGCGKSFVSLKLMEDNSNANVLFVSPSKPIRNQMYDYIIKYLSTEESEEKIRAEELRKGRKLHREEKVKVIFPGFATVLYQTIISKSKRAQDILDKLDPDFIICDEVHHMKTIDDDEGKEKSEEEIQAELQKEANIWGTRMQEFIKNNPQAKVLGLTATPERGDGVNVAIRFFDGKVASEISLIEALTSDTIPIKSPDYVPCEYTLMNEIDEESVQEQIEKYKITNPQKARELQEKLDELRKIAESGKGIPDLFTEHLTSDEAKSMGRDKGKYIIFCDNIEDMKEKMAKAKEWFAGVDSNPEIYSVSSKQKDNEQQIKNFENSDSNHIKLLFSVDMLNEGLHVDDVSGVIMSRKTNSRIVYLQQLGRALSSDSNKQKPIVFDLANNYLTYNIYNELIESRKKVTANKLHTKKDTDFEEQEFEKDNSMYDTFKISGIMSDLVELLEESQKSRNVIQEFIETLQKLKAHGVDVTKMTKTDIIETLAKKSGADLSELESLGLDLEEKIGSKKNNISKAYRGKGSYVPPTKEQVEALKKLGISLELKDTTQEFIETLQKLKAHGVDVTKMTVTDTIETLAKKSGVDLIELESLGLDLKEKIGSKKNTISKAFRGKSPYVPPTEEQVKMLEELGISLELKDTVQECIETLQKLKAHGVDVTKMTTTDTIETLAKKSGADLSELESLGLDLKEKIGRKKYNISQAFRGMGTYVPPTQEQVEMLEELGISLERKIAKKGQTAQDTFEESGKKLEAGKIK